MLVELFFKLSVLPVRFESANDLAPQVRQLILTDLSGPFQPSEMRGMRKVGRANIGTAKASLTMKQICLGWEPRSLGIVTDSNFRS